MLIKKTKAFKNMMYHNHYLDLNYLCHILRFILALIILLMTFKKMFGSKYYISDKSGLVDLFLLININNQISTLPRKP